MFASALGYGLESLTTAVVAVRVYAVALTLVGMVFWMKIAIGLDADGETAAMFGFFHLVYGVVLGAFVGSSVLT